jgi:NADPH:quinone reductase-like Zn-dependent oxidoreductase
MMRAIVLERYGSPHVLELRDINEPSITDDDQVLVRVEASSANPADWHLMRGDPRIARLDFGLRGPKDRVQGSDLAGRVEAVGRNVTRFQPGDEVFGSTFGHGLGAFAELCLCASEDLLAPKPATLTLEQAAAVPISGLTALQGLRDQGRVESGQSVLIIGASGGVGTFAVQIAKSFGAEVSGVTGSQSVDNVRAIGVDQVIDYTREDFSQGERRYDLILQLGGTSSPSACRRALTSEGTLVGISGDSNGHLIGPLDRVIKAKLLSPFVSQRLVSFLVEPNGEDLRFLAGLIEAGKVTPVIDRTYPLSEVPHAIRHLEDGHPRGKIVITI